LAQASSCRPTHRHWAWRQSIVGDDPLPNGLARNRKALEAIARFANEQKILLHPVKPEEMFAANTLKLA